MENTVGSWQSWGFALIISLLIISLNVIKWYIQKPASYRGKARIDGKTVVITGGNVGIGKETARELSIRGGKVIILCRDTRKGDATAKKISEESGMPVSAHHLDLTDFDSVRMCATLLIEKEPKIDILINNAGVVTSSASKTKDGFETTFQTNHLGHFLLTLLLLDNLKAASPSRIVNVSALAHVIGSINWENLNLGKSYNSTKAYVQSKLANILFTKSLAKKLEGTAVTAYALHPGVVHTELLRAYERSVGSVIKTILHAFASVFLKTPRMGAQTTVYCAVDEDIANESGKYYSGCAEKRPSSKARNEEDAERLWKLSLIMVGLSKDFTV